MENIDQIKSAITNLIGSDIVELQSFVSRFMQEEATKVQIANRTEHLINSTCVHCAADKPIKWGKCANGNQRFKCRSCSKTYSATTATPVYRLRNRQLWSKYLKLMAGHISLRALQDEHGFELSLSTLHRWRHRFLAPLSGNLSQQLAGLIEADEKFFRTSFKGDRGWKRGTAPDSNRKARKRGGASQRGLGHEQVPVLTALDRSGAVCQAKLPDTKWSSISNEMQPWIERRSVICSDGNLAYQRISHQTGCEHMVAGKGGSNTQGLSIGRINAYHRDVENLVNRRCLGVGTRYLMNYTVFDELFRLATPDGTAQAVRWGFTGGIDGCRLARSRTRLAHHILIILTDNQP